LRAFLGDACSIVFSGSCLRAIENYHAAILNCREKDMAKQGQSNYEIDIISYITPGQCYLRTCFSITSTKLRLFLAATGVCFLEVSSWLLDFDTGFGDVKRWFLANQARVPRLMVPMVPSTNSDWGSRTAGVVWVI
jgi:hypothetical protein